MITMYRGYKIDGRKSVGVEMERYTGLLMQTWCLKKFCTRQMRRQPQGTKNWMMRRNR
jgi:hypothetical protein